MRVHISDMVSIQHKPNKREATSITSVCHTSGIATSTQKDVALLKLKLAGLDDYFDNITCGCEVTQGKPNPEIYLLAAQRLGVKPQYCLAFEDSNNGAKSALAADMKTYQIPDLVTPSEEVKSLGVLVRHSLEDVLDELETAFN